MWYNHPFSQENKETKRTVGLEDKSNGEEKIGKNLKKGGLGIIGGGLHKVGG